MRPFTTTVLLKPPDVWWQLEHPDYDDIDTATWVVPTYFNPDEYIKRIHVRRSTDFIHIYPRYHVDDEDVSLMVYYVNNSGRNFGYGDFEIDVILNDIEKEILRNKMLGGFHRWMKMEGII